MMTWPRPKSDCCRGLMSMGMPIGGIQGCSSSNLFNLFTSEFEEIIDGFLIKLANRDS